MKLTTILESQLSEKWGVDTTVAKSERGKYKGKTLAQLRSMRSKLKKKKERTEADTDKLRELNFAIRAKTGWGKVSERQLGEIDMDDYDDRFHEFLQIKWQEDYTSVFDALDGYIGDDDWEQDAQKATAPHDFEDVKVHDDDLKAFRSAAISNSSISPQLKDAVTRWGVEHDEFFDKDPDSYRDDFNDSEEYRRDPYGYHGVRRRDFF